MRSSATAATDLSSKPGRNDLCPCGSGKKFKHCHGQQSAAPASPAGLGAQQIGALVTLVNHGRFGEAEQQARSLLAADPASGMLWKILGVALLRQGKDALPALRRAAELMPSDAEALRNLGAELHERGQWGDALDSLRGALALEPEHTDALVQAADALRGLGRAREAVPLYQRALARNSRVPEAQNNLGNAFLELGQFADAVRCYGLAAELMPADAQVRCNLGNGLRRLGRVQEALAEGRRAVALDPGLSVARTYLGLSLAQAGHREEAIASFRQALELNPGDLDALNNLGSVLRDLGDRRGAVPLYRRAIELDPRRAESHCNLGNVLFELRQVEEAVAAYRQSIELQPDYAPAHLSLAFAFRQQRRPDEAELSCQAALALNPNYVEALSFLGELKADRGQFAEAEQLFGRAIELNPDFAFARASIATHRKMTVDDGKWLEGAEALLAKPLPLGHEISLRYALGKYFDDVRQYDAAFGHFRQANELTKRYGVRYNAAKLTERIDGIASRFGTRTPHVSPDAVSDSDLPIFIVGMPRSGTSLAEQILASHPAVFGAGEVTYWNAAYDAFRDAERDGTDGATRIPGFARSYLQHVASLSPKATRVVDKMPANFMYAGLIHAALPRARIIHMRRHAIDTSLSIYFQNFFNIGPYANDLDSLAHYYGEYSRISAHWRAVLPSTALLEVPYEGLIADQEGWTRRMLEFVGLPWDSRCLDFHQTDRVVITASKWQVRQKISSASAGRWRNYEAHVGPLRQLLDLPTAT